MILSEKQIQLNYNRFIDKIKTEFQGDRLEKLLKIYEEDYADRIATMPASYNVYMHNCFVGGYVDHVLRVTELVGYFFKLYQALDVKLPDGFEKELIFAAMNHDLGKVGTKDEPYFIFEESEYFKRKGNIYKINSDKTGYMKAPDRTLFILQQYGVTMSKNEYLAIKLHDGLFDEGNKPYFSSWNPKARPDDVLISAIHMADYMAATIEKQLFMDKLIKENKL